MRYLALLQLALFIFSACGSENEDYERILFPNDMPTTYIEGKQMYKDQYRSFFIDGIDSLVLVSSDNEPLLNVFNAEGNKIAGFGKLGRGPNEFSHVLDFKIESRNFISTFDYVMLAYYQIDLERSIDQQNMVVSQRHELPKELRGITELFAVNDEHLIGIYDDLFQRTIDGGIGIFTLNLMDNSIGKKSLIFLNIESGDDIILSNINVVRSAISPDKSKIALIKLYSPLLEIFDTELNRHKIYAVGNDPIKYDFEMDDFMDGKLKQYYTAIHATDEHIYLLYKGADSGSESWKSAIHVINWEGEPIRKYEIQGDVTIDVFTVLENGSTIYGISYAEDAIYKFEIK